jgi:hypothetical protein
MAAITASFASRAWKSSEVICMAARMAARFVSMTLPLVRICRMAWSRYAATAFVCYALASLLMAYDSPRNSTFTEVFLVLTARRLPVPADG